MTRHISFIVKSYNDFERRSNNETKQSDEILIEEAVKAIIQNSYDKGLFHNYYIVDEVLRNYLVFEYKERRRPNLDPLKGASTLLDFSGPIIDVIRGFFS